MDGFQFVFESPQATQNHKKRPRLVPPLTLHKTQHKIFELNKFLFADFI